MELGKKQKLTNKFGEEIELEEIKKIGRKISKLPKKEIDNIWAKVGWKEKGCESNKALPDWRLEKMKKEKAFATKVTENLFLETPLDEFRDIFKELNYKNTKRT